MFDRPCDAGTITAQQEAGGYKPVVTFNEIMVNIVDPHSHEIWDATANPAKAPKTSQDWRNVRHAAVTLAAGGSLTSMSGNEPEDQAWRSQGKNFGASFHRLCQTRGWRQLRPFGTGTSRRCQKPVTNSYRRA